MSEHGMPLGTILIADEDEALLDLAEGILRPQGYRVLSALNGAEARARMESEKVDLALLSANLPTESGLEVCRAIKGREETRGTPVVLLASPGRTADRRAGIEAGADDFLNKPLRKEELLARARSLVRLKHSTDELEDAEAMLCALARSVEAKGGGLDGHGERLARYAVALAARLGLPESQRVALRRGAIVHDIGKIAVPDAILLKPGPLDREERRLMEAHTTVGANMCAPLKAFRGVLPMIRWHHERQDGSGYPDRLKGSAVPLTARILQMADIYDALTSDRPYRKALSSGEALVILRLEAARGWRDAALVEILEESLKDLQGLKATIAIPA